MDIRRFLKAVPPSSQGAAPPEPPPPPSLEAPLPSPLEPLKPILAGSATPPLTQSPSAPDRPLAAIEPSNVPQTKRAADDSPVPSPQRVVTSLVDIPSVRSARPEDAVAHLIERVRGLARAGSTAQAVRLLEKAIDKEDTPLLVDLLRRELRRLKALLATPATAADASKPTSRHRSADHKTGFADVADEVLLSVFSYLPFRDLLRCQRVCRRWRRLAADASLLGDICFAPHGRRVRPHLVDLMVVRSASKLRSLDLTDCIQLNDTAIRRLSSPFVPSLNRLVLDGCTGISAAAIRQTVISLSGTLVSLSVRRTQADDTSLVPMRDLSKLVLQRLDVGGLSSLFSQLQRSGVPPQWRGIKHLTSLNVSGCGSLTDAMLNSILRCTPQLEELNVEQCPLVSHGILHTLGARCLSLKSLSCGTIFLVRVDWCTPDDSVLMLSAGCDRLMRLSVGNAKNWTDSMVSHISTLGGLTELTLLFAHSLTDAAFSSIAKGLRNLVTLRIQHTKLSSLGIQPLVIGCQRLQHLDVGFAARVDDAALDLIGDFLSGLKELCVAQSAVTTSGVKRCATRLAATLEVLDISYCFSVSMMGLVAVRELLPRATVIYKTDVATTI